MSRPVAGNPDNVARNENLPLPIVKYSTGGGCFIGFKEKEDGHLYFCDCAKDAIENFIQERIDGFLRTYEEVSVDNIAPLFQDEIQKKPNGGELTTPGESLIYWSIKKSSVTTATKSFLNTASATKCMGQSSSKTTIGI